MLPLYPNNIRFPVITIMLISINILVFMYLSMLTPVQLTQVYNQYGVIPALCYDQRIRFLTYGFIHDHFSHLIGNMWLLWISGSVLESRQSRTFYVVIVVLSAIVTSLIFCLTNPENRQVLIGLSGAIAGIIGCVFVIADNTIRTYIFPAFIVDINVKVLAATWFSIQCFLMILNPQSEVAFISHVSGFLFGTGVGLLTWAQVRITDKY